MIMNDREIKQLQQVTPIFTPFIDQVTSQVDGNPTVSFGCSSFGYDVRLSNEFKVPGIEVPEVAELLTVDPKDPESISLAYSDVTITDKDHVVIPPFTTIFGKTVEYFDVPDDVMMVCLGKSTYARIGIQVIVTPIEPGFKGNVVLEIVNSTQYPVMLYINEGICQFLLFKGSRPDITYADRDGKYQLQSKVLLSHFKKGNQ